ncbi:hypothetical protein [Priestia koreensis]|uniref:hypothetical protein n=1 Tax=Priestia koreensis TaxID=284581 RepID=UPI001F56EB18|nr:hypothetical protein [Priestia koreensis]UNL85795.1 hypothetical protein IE339_04585 [Priestia koreensis]
MLIGIISSPERDKIPIILALEECQVEYVFLDIFDSEWISKFNDTKCDGYLLFPPAITSLWRDIFYKRITLIKNLLDSKCVPTVDEILYYESKILMSDFYKINNIPHVNSVTFFNFRDAWQYVKNTSLPKVIKSDGGSGGIGVKIIKSKLGISINILKSFFWGNFKFKFDFTNINNVKKMFKRILYPLHLFQSTGYMYFPPKDINKGYIHIQDSVNIKTEWRIVKIGTSYFGHQKLKGSNGMHSGSHKVGWIQPPFKVLDLVKNISCKLKITSMAFDIFETENGEFLVNEMQTIFGAFAPSQMYIDGIPGRYVFKKGEWNFEEGEFCKFKCNSLRIEHLVRMLNEPLLFEAK